MDASQYVDPYEAEANLSPNERRLRHAFVEYYLLDYNQKNACLKLGFLEPYARDWGDSFLGEGYVQRLINSHQGLTGSAQPEDEKDKRVVQLISWLEEIATNEGASATARVQAINKISELEGLQNKNDNNGIEGATGGVMVVPLMTTPEQWGQMAATNQDALKAKADEVVNNGGKAL